VFLTYRNCSQLDDSSECEKRRSANTPRVQSTKLLLNAQRGSESTQESLARDRDNCATASQEYRLENREISRTRLRILDSNSVRLSRETVSSAQRGARLFIDNRKRKRARHFTDLENQVDTDAKVAAVYFTSFSLYAII